MKRMLSLAAALLAAACAFSAAGCSKTGNDPADNAEKNKWYAMNAVSNSYAFPEYEGEEALDWKQAIEFHQIPAETLGRMSTDGLIETCLDYPFYSAGMVFSNSTLYDGFIKTCNEFNGLQELFGRTDAPEKLVRLYREASPSTVKGSDEYAALRMRYLQYIIAQDEILEGLSREHRKQLLDECMKKIGQYYEGYGDEFALDPALMIAVRICMKDSESFRALAVEEPWLEGLAKGGLLTAAGDGLQRALESINEYSKGG